MSTSDLATETAASPVSVTEHMEWRYAVKAFDPDRDLSDDVLDALLETLRLSPSSFGLQPWRFIRVESVEVRGRLAEAAPLNGAKIKDAPLVLVLARMRAVPQEHIDRYIEDMRVTRGQAWEDVERFHTMVSARLASMPPEHQSAWTARQVYVALGCTLAAAAMLEVDSCPMEGIDPPAFDIILGLDGTNYTTTVCLAVGYRSPADPYATLAKARFDPDEVFRTV